MCDQILDEKLLVFRLCSSPTLTKTKGDKNPKSRMKQRVLLGVALSITNVVSSFGATVANEVAIWTTVILKLMDVYTQENDAPQHHRDTHSPEKVHALWVPKKNSNVFGNVHSISITVDCKLTKG
jgi:hypothetical protein